jgi:PAS domain S-box-containing protein
MLSDEACRIFGIAEQGLSLTLNEWHPRWVALIHPDDQPRLIELLGDVLAGIRSYDVEYRVIRPDGAVRFIYSQAEVERDASGHAHNMLGMMQDITERKQAELALRASENRFRVLSENAFVGIYIIQDGLLSYCNSTQAKIFGYTPEELIGTDPRLLVHPDDQAMVVENIRRRIDGEIETIHYEFRGRCKDGSIKNIEVLGGRIDFSGKTAVIGNLMDITDRKRAENEIARSLAAEKKARRVAEILREATESLSRTLHLEDILHKLLEYLLQLIPYDSANVMLLEDEFHLRVVALRGYERWTDLNAARKLVFDTREIPSLHELVTTKQSIQIANTYEYPGWARVAGTEHIVSWLGIPIITDGQVIGLYSVDKVEPAFFSAEDRILAEGLAAQAAIAIQNRRLHDQITRANVELEQRVADRTAQLEESNSELEAFAYSVSHDLRAPLRHIDGFIELLQKRTKTRLDDKSQHYMDMISDSAQKMGILIDDLLSFSRMGRQEIYTSKVDLNDLIQDIMHDSETEIRGRNIQWKISRLPLVTGDRAMLRVVLANLIVNAVKFTRPKEFAEIEIGYEANESEITLFVRDNGVGFDMKYVDKLFGVFQRLHSQEDFEGTGIGLANVHRIIRRHGGRTWAEGQVDHGATFYFSLPTTN